MTSWVLLRGLTRESRHWGAFPDVLAARFPGAPVVAPDLPGNGRLNGERSPCSIAAMAGACRRAVAAAGVAPPYVVLALSLGAMVAVEWARRHPGDVDGLVLVNTSFRPHAPFRWRLRPANYGALLRLPWTSVDLREQAILRLTSTRAHDAGTVLRWAAYGRERPVSPANAVRQLIAAARYRCDAPPVGTPLLLLGSAQDALVDVRCSRALADAWQVPLAVHPTAGHDLTYDDPEWVAARVRSWVGG